MILSCEVVPMPSSLSAASLKSKFSGLRSAAIEADPENSALKRRLTMGTPGSKPVRTAVDDAKCVVVRDGMSAREGDRSER